MPPVKVQIEVNKSEPLSIEDLIDVKCKQALERLIEQQKINPTHSDSNEKKNISSTKDEENSLAKFACNLNYDDPYNVIEIIEDTDEDTEEIDPKLLSLPLVYTTKLDHMGLFKNKSFEINNNKVLIDIVNYRSNPVKNKFLLEHIEIDKESMIIEISDDDDIEIITTESLNDNEDGVIPTRTKPFYDDGDIVFRTIATLNDDEELHTSKDSGGKEIEDNVSDTQRVKLSSDLFRKPHIRKYNPSELLKNPDFNSSLKKLNTSFVSSFRNLILMSYLKRLTVDVSKAFETKLVNNRMYFKQDEENIHLNQDNTKILKNTYEIPTDTSIYDEGDICNSEINVRDTNEVISIVPERNTAIHLPNMTEVRRVNQKLLTAEVLPVQIQDSLVKKAQDYLVSRTQDSLVSQKGNSLLSQTCDNLVTQKGIRLVSQNSLINQTHNSVIEQTQDNLVSQKQGIFISKTQENLFSPTKCSLVGQTENLIRQINHDLDNCVGGSCVRETRDNLFAQTQNRLDSQERNNLIRNTQGSPVIRGNLIKQTQADLINRNVDILIRETQESSVKQNSLNRDKTQNNLFNQTQDNLFSQTQENWVSQTQDILIRQAKKSQKSLLKKTMIIPNITNLVTNTAPSNISNNTSINESEKTPVLSQDKTIINLQTKKSQNSLLKKTMIIPNIINPVTNTAPSNISINVSEKTPLLSQDKAIINLQVVNNVQNNVKDILTQPVPKISPIRNTCICNNIIYLVNTPYGNKIQRKCSEECIHQKENTSENKASTTNQLIDSNIDLQPKKVHPMYVNINRNILPVTINRPSEIDVSQRIVQNSTPVATPTHTFMPSVTEFLVLPNGELSCITNTEMQNSVSVEYESVNEANLIPIQSNHINLESIKNDRLSVITTNSSATTHNTSTEIFYLSTSPSGASDSSSELKPLSTVSQQEIINNKDLMCELNMRNRGLSHVPRNVKNKNNTGKYPEKHATIYNKTLPPIVSTKLTPSVSLASKPALIPVTELETRIGIGKKPPSAVNSSQQNLHYAKRNQGQKQPFIIRSAYMSNSQNFAKRETIESKNNSALKHFLVRNENHLDYKKGKGKNSNCGKNINQTATSLNMSSVINECARVPLKIQERKKRFSDGLELYYEEPLSKNRKISTPKAISTQTITPSANNKSNEDPNLNNWIILGL